MGGIDKRGVLDENLFSYRIAKDNTVRISWQGRVVKTLSGSHAQQFVAKITGADDKQAQRKVRGAEPKRLNELSLACLFVIIGQHSPAMPPSSSCNHIQTERFRSKSFS